MLLRKFLLDCRGMLTANQPKTTESAGPGMHHMGRHGWPSQTAHGDPTGAADAHDAGPPAEKMRETSATRRLRGAADAHDAGSRASENVRKTQTTL